MHGYVGRFGGQDAECGEETKECTWKHEAFFEEKRPGIVDPSVSLLYLDREIMES